MIILLFSILVLNFFILIYINSKLKNKNSIEVDQKPETSDINKNSSEERRPKRISEYSIKTSNVEDNWTTLPYIQNNRKVDDEDTKFPYKDYISFCTVYHSNSSREADSSYDSCNRDAGNSTDSSCNGD